MALFRTPRLAASLFVICGMLWITGCSKLNQENYNKIEMGMPYAEVVELIGKPDSCGDVLKVKDCSWGDEAKNVNIKFIGEQVIFFKATGLN